MPAQPGFYTKKPVTIQAIQFTDETRDALTAWLTAELDPALWRIRPGYLEIATLEGDRDCPLGYWIVKGTVGEFYPVHPDVFTRVYEPADGAS